MQLLALAQPFGTDFFCLGKKFLVYNLVSRNLKTKYRRSVLGLFWTLLAPIATASVYYFVFKVVLQVKIPHYPVFILSGVLYWNFFAGSLMEGMESIVANWGLISKVPIPLQVFSYVGTLTNLVTLLLSTPVLCGAAVLSGTFSTAFLMLAVYAFILFFSAYAIAFILSVCFVFLRDLRHILGILMQIWFYGTPVVYNATMIPEKFRFVLYLNPVGLVFKGLTAVVTTGQWPERTELLVTFAWAVALVFFSAFLLKRYGKDLVEQI